MSKPLPSCMAFQEPWSTSPAPIKPISRRAQHYHRFPSHAWDLIDSYVSSLTEVKSYAGVRNADSWSAPKPASLTFERKVHCEAAKPLKRIWHLSKDNKRRDQEKADQRWAMPKKTNSTRLWEYRNQERRPVGLFFCCFDPNIRETSRGEMIGSRLVTQKRRQHARYYALDNRGWKGIKDLTNQMERNYDAT